MPLSPPLEPATHRRLAALITHVGEKRACILLDIPRATLARAAARLGLRRATAEVLTMRLDALDADEQRHRTKRGA